MQQLIQQLQQIQPLDHAIQEQAQQQIDGLVKPFGSLGRLEALAVQLAGISRSLAFCFPHKKVIVMLADHGVCAENIAISPQAVTRIGALNLIQRKTGVCALAKSVGADVLPVDVGIISEPIDGLLCHKTRKGSGNIAKELAMTRQEAINLLQFGIQLVQQEVAQGLNVLAVGEFGIGNTTAAAAMISAFTGARPCDTVGIGANYPRAELFHKIKIVEQILALHQPDANDGIDVLHKVGGFDLCGMTGLMLGAAIAGIPVVLDGMLSYASALAAMKIAPAARDYMIASHLSAEKASVLALAALGLTPYLNMEMRLGEGSGAVLAFPLIDAACAMVQEMGSLSESQIVLPDPEAPI